MSHLYDPLMAAPPDAAPVSLLAALLDYGREALGADHTTYCTFDSDSDSVLVMGASGDIDHPEVAVTGRSLPATDYTSLSELMARGDPTISRSDALDLHPAIRAFHDRVGVRAQILVPVSVDGATGFLEAFYRDLDGIDSNRLESARRLAPFAAAALSRDAMATKLQEAQQALRESESGRRRVLGAMLRAEEAERVRIATELHDDTIQVMTATLIGLDRAIATLGPSAAGRSLELARTTLAAALERTRRLMFELRPVLLQARGIAAAVRAMVDEAQAEAGFRVDLEVFDERLEPELELLIYRTVREAVSNARKHAGARVVAVTLRLAGDRVIGEVSDDGRGFDTGRATNRELMRLHLGLESMAERVRLAGGTIETRSTPGAGTTVAFSLPVGRR